MAVFEAFDLDSAATKVTIGSPVIDDGNIADFRGRCVSHLAICRKNWRQLHVRVDQDRFFPDYLVAAILIINLDELKVAWPKFVSQ